MAANVWRCEPGEKIVDFGCGTGDVLEFLPDGVDYVGVDISETYVMRARERFGRRGTFVVGSASTLMEQESAAVRDAQLMMCNGLLHHLNDDEVLDVLQLAATVLRPAGRLVCWEPAYLRHQPAMSRWIMGQDRGRNIRSDAEWGELARRVFPDSSTRVVTGLLRLPYTHIVLESTNRDVVPMRTDLELTPRIFDDRAVQRDDARMVGPTP